MRILLLGMNGQVGGALQKTLPPLGAILAFNRSRCDLRQLQQIKELIQETKPDVIVNAAAYTAVDRAEIEVEEAYAVNAEAPKLLAELAQKQGALLVHYSTNYVFDGQLDRAYIETDAPAPLNVYGASKRAGEMAIEKVGGRYLIFRTSWVFSPRGHNFVISMLEKAKGSGPLEVVADQVGQPTPARLIAELTAQVLQQPHFPPGYYHLAAAGEISWYGFAAHLIREARALGFSTALTPDDIRPIPSTAFPRPARRPANSRLNTGKLAQALKMPIPGWQGLLNDDLKQLIRSMHTP